VHHDNVTIGVERLIGALALLGDQLQEPVLLPQLFVGHEAARAFLRALLPGHRQVLLPACGGQFGTICLQ
jgi:hypothetical protein